MNKVLIVVNKDLNQEMHEEMAGRIISAVEQFSEEKGLGLDIQTYFPEEEARRADEFNRRMADLEWQEMLESRPLVLD